MGSCRDEGVNERVFLCSFPLRSICFQLFQGEVGLGDFEIFLLELIA